MVPILALIFLSGCGQQEAATTTTTSTTTTTTYASYFPLITGRVITYEVMTHSETVDAATHQFIVTDETTFETWQYAGLVSLTSTLEVFKINVILGGSSSLNYYREDSSGVYFYGSGSQPTIESEVLLKYPLAVGASWESGTIFGSNEVVAEGTVETSAGNFNCKKVSYIIIPGAWEYRWFAKDIGLIKEFSGYAGVGNLWTSREVLSKNF